MTKPTMYNGSLYTSLTAAAKAAGVTVRAASYHLKRYGTLDRAGKHNCSSVTWKGKEYPSQNAAAKAAGCSAANVSMHLARYGNLDRLMIGGNGRQKNV